MFSLRPLPGLLRQLGTKNSGWEFYPDLWRLNLCSVSVELHWTPLPASLRLTSKQDPSHYWPKQLKPCDRSKKHIAVQMPRDSLSHHPLVTITNVDTRWTSGDTANGKRRIIGRVSSPISLDDTPTATLLDEPATLPLLETRLCLTSSSHRTRLQSQEPTANHHSYFQSHRRRQDQRGQRRLRTPISALWVKIAGLEWLQNKDLGKEPRAAQQAEGAVPEHRFYQ